jgi:tetratricopeptide (TPR) repeat protein
MKKHLTFISMAFIMAAMITACSKVPQAEIDAAEALMDTLEAAGAEIYLPDDFAKFDEAYTKAVEEVKKQGAKTFKSYKGAKEMMIEATDIGEKLAEDNSAKKAELKEKIEAVYEEAFEKNNDNKNLIPKKGGTTGVKAFQREVDDITSALEEVADVLENDGNLIKAMEIVEQAKEDAEDVNERLSKVAATQPVKKTQTTKTSTMQMKPAKKKK